jgi:hypothetical protein
VDIDETNSSMEHEEVSLPHQPVVCLLSQFQPVSANYGLAALVEFDGKELTFDVSTRYKKQRVKKKRKKLFFVHNFICPQCCTIQMNFQIVLPFLPSLGPFQLTTPN